MTRLAASSTDGWGVKRQLKNDGQLAADVLLRAVDAGLCGVIFVAPYFFGGRHDTGRLLLVSIIAITAVAWFVRQSMLGTARLPRTAAYLLMLLAAALVAFQIVPLPDSWIACLSPRTGQLLPLWSAGEANGAGFGSWHTLSLIPHESAKSLAMLLSYCLLFTVVAGRIEEKSDAERLLRWVAISAAAMAVIGLVHCATTDGRFMWIYWHPHRIATEALSGPFINRNHFADFLVLGIGPLLAWLLHAARHLLVAGKCKLSSLSARQHLELWAVAAASALVVLTTLLSRSRGGSMVLLVAGGVLVTIYICRGLVDSRVFYGLVGLAVVVVGLLSLHGYDQVVQRLDDFTEGSLDDVDQGGIRREIWAANIAAFRAGLVTGVGAGSHVEFCPVYLPQSYMREYTHAENGYLQIASENGIGGVALVAAGIVLCGAWCIRGLRQAADPEIVRLLGAAAAGLAASAAHSVVDFVWYIPACMTITLILAACALRLSQLAQSDESRATCSWTPARGRWIELVAASLLIGGWTVHMYLGPGIAAIHWDRYLRASVANTEISRRQLMALIENGSAATDVVADQASLNNTMLGELEQVIGWDPQFARAHLRLAARCAAQFDLLQQQSQNAMGLGQIRDVLATNAFTSTADQHAWVGRVFGANLDWLRRAVVEARVAASLCPLQGEAYVYLAQLSFLNDTPPSVVNAYVDQGLRVRPHDADVLFEVGRQEFIAGDVLGAISRWKQCYGDTGPHQQKIAYLVSKRMSAASFVETFHPDWRTLRGIWAQYRDAGQPEDLDALLSYSTKAAEHQTDQDEQFPQAFIWLWQSQFYADVNRPEEALRCLEKAYASGPRYYFIRRALASALQASGRLAEAEPHFRWCMARHPDDRNLSAALIEISKQRLAQREVMLVSAQEPVSPAVPAQTPAPPAVPASPTSAVPK